MSSKHLIAATAVAIALLAPGLALAQATTFNDNFTGASDSTGWTALAGACLTAGNGTGTIPACVGLPYYSAHGTQTWVGGNSGTLPDPVGSGALRLTNGCTGSGCSNGGNFNYGYAQAGGIISPTFAAGSGIQISFKTFTYEGNSGGSGNDGADGISFFILDGTKIPPYAGSHDVGAFGGSLGYTCTDALGNDDINYHPGGAMVRGFDGVYAGYLGLGIDEYGNFLNPGDNTATGPGYKPERIGLRGPGSVNWYSLQNTFGTTLFPTSWTTTTVGSTTCSFQSSSVPCTEAALAVHYTCKNGYLSDYKNNAIAVGGVSPYPVPDYNYITNAYTVLPSTNPIANESATTRGQAVPITYSLKITQNGILSLSYSYNGGAYQQVLAPQNVASLIGSLPPTLRFGFAGSTGGSTNVHEIACFEAGPPSGADTSVGVNQKEASKIATGTQAFLAFYDPTTWTGDVTANSIVFSGGVVSVNTAANWDASCGLTGVASGQKCLYTGASGPINAQAPTSRVMLTWNGTQGIPFEWGSLTTAQQNAIDAGDATPLNGNRVQYLRGDRTNEINSSGVGSFRARVSVLGDVVDSSPTWVGFPDSPYANVWKDRLYPSNAAPENGSATYSQFAGAQAQRLNIVYVGSNDGFLHGFEAGSYDTNHNFVSNSATPNDGKEVFAYMPGAVLQTIHNAATPSLDYANAQYAHNFFVDATPDQDDLFYGGNWHTWLVGGLGAGGSALYALDVTNPSNFSESTANAASTVIGEWTPATISCTNVTSCGANLGNTYGVPVIRRLHNGMWGVIFGNGYGSSSGDAGIFIMTIDPSSGAKTFYYLSAGQSGKSDGIAYPSPADLDGDNVIDYVYAGDLNGNVWRFDLTSSNPLNWTVNSTPVFTDPSGHPITTKITVGATLVSQGSPRVIIDFGTGRKVPLTVTSPATYATGSQTIYGIWDWNMATWNSQSPNQYASLVTGPASIGLSNLQQQTLSPASASGVYDDTSNTVCWGDGSTCGTNPQYGWYLQLPNSQEQVIFNPLLYQGTLYINTIIPPNNSPLNCNPSTETGNTYAVSGTTGGVVPHLFPLYTDANAAGESTDPSGSPFVVLAGGGAYVLTQSTASMNNENLPSGGPFACTGMVCETQVAYHGASGQRLTWMEKR